MLLPSSIFFAAHHKKTFLLIDCVFIPWNIWQCYFLFLELTHLAFLKPKHNVIIGKFQIGSPMGSNYLTLLFTMAVRAYSALTCHACLHMFIDNAKQVLLHVAPCAWTAYFPLFSAGDILINKLGILSWPRLGSESLLHPYENLHFLFAETCIAMNSWGFYSPLDLFCFWSLMFCTLSQS